jgi:hypothetical protein
VWIIAGVVLALVAGLIGWFSLRGTPENLAPPTPTPPPKPTLQSPFDPTVTGPAFTTIPVDLLGGLPAPNGAQLAGVWDGVMVVVLSYDAAGTVPTVILRGVDTQTGEIRWTYDTLPGGDFFGLLSDVRSAIIESDGRMAWMLQRTVNQSEGCAGETFFLVVSVATGEVGASASAPVRCDTGRPIPTRRLTAYQDGIVVFNDVSGPTTLAFRDTDLVHPLWTVAGEAVETPSGQGSIVVPPGWVQTVGGSYVHLTDGHPASAAFSTAGGAAWSVWAAGGLALVASESLDPDLGIALPWVNSFTAWRDLGADHPDWTYTPEPGWVIAGNEVAADPIRAVTDDAVIVLEVQYVDYVITAARLAALSFVDGHVIWSVPYPYAEADLSTYAASATATTSGDDTLVAGKTAEGYVIRTLRTVRVTAIEGYIVDATTTEVGFLDAKTGAGKFTMSGDNSSLAPTLIPCGAARVCVLDFVSDSLRAITITAAGMNGVYSSPGTFVGVTATDQGLVALVEKAIGTGGYAILRV